MDMLLMALPSVLVLLVSNNFMITTALNSVLQFTVFLLTANIPALVTGRMSYVDIAWPWGLVTIGLLPLISETQGAGVRVKLVMAAYLAAGARMAFGGAVLFFTGRLQQEFPRYLYQRQNWAKEGITDEASWRFKLTMQKEIIVQCLANMGALSLPMMVQSFGYMRGPLTWLEICGWTLWFLSIVFEHTADLQKKKYVKECIKNNVKNGVCDVGLWRYSRHPNYFGEWMVWNCLILTSVPSLLALWETPKESLVTKLGTSIGLFSISLMMYQCLVHYTGAVPAEYYSVRKRPEYVEYQEKVNMFVPGPRREGGDRKTE